jgi:hypothetical protein
MHAVVVSVSIAEDADPQEITTHLRENIVPRVSQAPGFVAGYWVRLEGAGKGRATIVFESEDAAQGAKGQIEPAPGVTIESIDVGEVVAHA